MTLVKVCPKCGHENDPSELYCTGGEVESECGYGIALTPITAAGGQATIRPEAVAPPSTIAVRLCINGHPLEEGDAVCIECGAGPAIEQEVTALVDDVASDVTSEPAQFLNRTPRQETPRDSRHGQRAWFISIATGLAGKSH